MDYLVASTWDRRRSRRSSTTWRATSSPAAAGPPNDFTPTRRTPSGRCGSRSRSGAAPPRRCGRPWPSWTIRAAIRGVAVTGMGMDGVPVDETGSGCTRSSAGTARAPSRSSTGGSSTSARRRPSPSAATRCGASRTALRLLWMAEHEPRDPGAHRQMAADRGFRQLHALRQAGHRLHHGLLHAPVRPAQAGLVGRDAAAVGHRPAAAVPRPTPAARRSAK